MQLFDPLKRALADQKYTQPTPIQSETIPPAIAGNDVLGCASTGTGKTAAFALPILDYLGVEKPEVVSKRPTSLVLAPTRELAIQIAESFKKYGSHMHFDLALIHGGVAQNRQTAALKKGVDVLIATPGRLLDLMDQGHLFLDDIQIFVLDEADRMLDMGFMPALKRIIAALPKDRQSLFFSATMPPKVRELASQLLFNPVTVTVASESPGVEKIAQTVRFVQRQEKLPLLGRILSRAEVDQAIVFTRTKRGANRLSQQLERNSFSSCAIHGNKSQAARQKAIDAFRQKRIKVLVATDIAARGIDVSGITHVVNYDLPSEPENYVHRIGRTGRAGASGTAISFCVSEEMDELRAIEKVVGDNLEVENPDSRFTSSSASPKNSSGRRRSSSRRTGAASSRPRNSKPGKSPKAKSKSGKPGSKPSRGRKRHTATAS